MMKELVFPTDMRILRGDWNSVPNINIMDIRARDIYFAPEEPSYVSWAILWKEHSGDLKLSFVEVTGDKTAWPPTYNFNSRDIKYYLKTLISKDGGETWNDTGWQEDLDPLWERNSDHHIRHVFELSDGTLMRNYCHTIKGVKHPARFTVYDETKENAGEFFPFSHSEPADTYPKFSSIWISSNGGKTWKEIYLFDKKPPFFITAIHPLSNGNIFAIGAFRPDERDYSTFAGAFSESKDCGKTWSKPMIIAENDDYLNPQGIGEECDFVELDDGKLFVIWRTDAQGSCMRQLYLERDNDGIWHSTPAIINQSFPHSGYPYMYRASDGTIFYYGHRFLHYSCDDGQTWDKLHIGTSYYGQLVEVSPGRMLAVTQKNMGDRPYPWRMDASMLQTTFKYKRIAVAQQNNMETLSSLAVLNVGEQQDFHIAMEVRINPAVGLAYQVTNAGYHFVALTIPSHISRLPANAALEPQNVFLQIGEVSGSTAHIFRKIWVGKTIQNSWAELQVSRKRHFLKAAVNLHNAKHPEAIYTCFKDENVTSGALALFTNKSKGAFQNVRFSSVPESIRNNWRKSGGLVEHQKNTIPTL